MTRTEHRSSTVERLDRERVRAASITLAEAFMDDPFYLFLLPKERSRRAWLRTLMAATTKMLLPDGHVYADTGADVPGVICASAPGQYPPPRRRSVIFLVKLLGAAFLGRPAPRRLPALIRALKATEHAHLGVPHWFIYELAVAAGQRGTGLGRRLLDAVLDQADAAGELVYLETTNEPNIGLYRHFGFEVSETLDCGGGVPPIWTMTRQPAGELGVTKDTTK